MANNITKSTNDIRTWNAILHKLGKRTVQEVIDHTWYSSGVPAVDAASQGTYPVELGDFAHDYTNTDNYVCTVAPAATTAATFVKMNG